MKITTRKQIMAFVKSLSNFAFISQITSSFEEYIVHEM